MDDKLSKKTNIVYNKQDLGTVIAELVALDVTKPTAIIVQDHDIRSLAQNSLLHMWVSLLAKESGYTPKELKAILKDKYLGYDEIINNKTDKVVKELRHTSDLKVGEFRDFLSEIENLASVMGVQLPFPEDIYREAMR